MRLLSDPFIPHVGSLDYDRQLNSQLVTLIRDVNNQVNGVTDGSIFSHHGAMTSAPTTGSWNQGDSVKNSAPAELGGGGNKYVITQFICVVAGTPGTWLQARSLTGN